MERKGHKGRADPAESYELRVGRWSRLVTPKFLEWLNPLAGLRWLDVGCGTGALSQVILDGCQPREVIGVDFSENELIYARSRLTDQKMRFVRGDASALPFPDESFGIVVCGLLFNLLSDPARGVAEMKRVVRRGGAWPATSGTSRGKCS